MNPRFKNIILFITGIAGVLVLTAILLAFLLQDKIEREIITQLNQQLTVPVQIKGGIHLSLLRHFPYASLILSDISIADKIQKDKELLNVKEISLLCNIFSLFGNHVELSKIFIREGKINIYRDEKGEGNYEILHPSTDTSKSNLAVQLKKAEIKNVEITYYDKGQNFRGDLEVNDMLLKGDFSSKQFELSAGINAKVNRIVSGKQELIFNRRLKGDIVLLVDNLNHSFTFKTGKLNIDDNDFDLTGSITALKKGTLLDFRLLHAGKNIQKLFGLFPERYRQSFANAAGAGEYTIAAEIKGLLSSATFPNVHVNAALKNSEIKLGRYNKLLKKVDATASYELDESGRDKIVISNFSCTLNDLPFNFKLTLSGLSDPDFDFYAQGVLHVAELSAFIPDSIMQDMDGEITFNNFHLKGRKRDFTDVEHSTLFGSGEFKLTDIEFRQNDITYGNINGLLSYEKQTINAEHLTTNFLGTQADFTGRIDNLAAFIYSLSALRNANNVVLGINGALKVKTFNLTGILDAYGKKGHPGSGSKGKIDPREIINMQGNLDIEIEKFIFRKMEFDNLRGNLQISPGVIRGNNLVTRTMDGEVKANGEVIFGDDYSLHTKFDVSAINLSLPLIFAECENFGQGVLTDRHLKGVLDAAISFSSVWDNYNELNQDKLSAVVDFSIRNGELIDFEPLRAASKFIRLEELKDIHFANLSNSVKIANRCIGIPGFEVVSSALNMMMRGNHYFNDSVDYHFKINLHKLLAQKFRRKLANVQYMEDDPYEGANLYLSVSGMLSNPKIEYDKHSGIKKMKSDFKSEKSNLKNLLNNAPEGRQDDNEKKREEKYYDIHAQPKFMDFDSTANQ